MAKPGRSLFPLASTSLHHRHHLGHYYPGRQFGLQTCIGFLTTYSFILQ